MSVQWRRGIAVVVSGVLVSSAFLAPNIVVLLKHTGAKATLVTASVSAPQ